MVGESGPMLKLCLNCVTKTKSWHFLIFWKIRTGIFIFCVEWDPSLAFFFLGVPLAFYFHVEKDPSLAFFFLESHWHFFYVDWDPGVEVLVMEVSPPHVTTFRRKEKGMEKLRKSGREVCLVLF